MGDNLMIKINSITICVMLLSSCQSNTTADKTTHVSHTLPEAFWPPAPGAEYHPMRSHQPVNHVPMYWPPEEHLSTPAGDIPFLSFEQLK